MTMRTAIVAMMMALFFAVASANPAWELVNQHGTPPSVRGGGMMRKVGDIYVLHGGFLECYDALNSSWDNTWYSDTFHFNPDNNRWTAISTNTAPSGRAFAGYQAYDKGNSMILYGGVQYSCNFQVFLPFGDMWEYFPRTHTWTQRYTTGGPGTRIGSALAIVEDKMYLHAGLDGFFQSHSDLWVLDLKTNVWTQLMPDNVPNTPAGRYLQKVEQKGDYIYIFGGNVNPTGGQLGVQWGDTWRYSISSNSWTLINTPSTVPTRVHGGSALTSKAFFLYLGDTNDDADECKTREESAGQFPTNRTDVLILHGHAQGWYPNVAVENPPKLKRFGYVQDGHEVFVWGGFDFVCSPILCTGDGLDIFGNPINGTHCYNPATSFAIWNSNMYRLDIRDLTDFVLHGDDDDDDDDDNRRRAASAAAVPQQEQAAQPVVRSEPRLAEREQALNTLTPAQRALLARL